MDPKTQADLDNHANINNPNNDAYWQSRGLDSRPDDDNDNDDDDYTQSDDLAEDRWGDDNESFHEEWVPQDAW